MYLVISLAQYVIRFPYINLQCKMLVYAVRLCYFVKRFISLSDVKLTSRDVTVLDDVGCESTLCDVMLRCDSVLKTFNIYFF